MLAYLGAIEAMDLDAVAALTHPEIEVVEHPNRLNPKWQRYDLAALRAAGEARRRWRASATRCAR